MWMVAESMASTQKERTDLGSGGSLDSIRVRMNVVLCFVRETPTFHRGGVQLMATENVALAAGAASGTLSKPDTQQQAPQGAIVNDFSIQIATVNGSGSQSANSVLLRSIFAMGIPVSGKNLFPSNIAGLPTWYTIRASKNGYVARNKEIDLLIAMNPETAGRTCSRCRPALRPSTKRAPT